MLLGNLLTSKVGKEANNLFNTYLNSMSAEPLC